MPSARASGDCSPEMWDWSTGMTRSGDSGHTFWFKAGKSYLLDIMMPFGGRTLHGMGGGRELEMADAKTLNQVTLLNYVPSENVIS